MHTIRTSRQRLQDFALTIALAFFFGFLTTVALQAQTYSYPDKLTVAGAYDPMLTNMIGRNVFLIQGASGQIHREFDNGFGIVGDVGYMHTSNMNNTKIGLSLLTLTGGGRYTWQGAYSNHSFYAQALIGDGTGFGSTFPGPNGTKSTASGLAVLAGGGLDFAVTPRWSIRAVEGDWLRTSLPNSSTNVQNNFRIGAGVKYRIN